jgi:hypothetical protein
MLLYSEKERITAGGREAGRPVPASPQHEVVVMVSLKAKRPRVLEVKLHRIVAELETVTGFRASTVQTDGRGSAVFRTTSWVAPDLLVRMLRARLEQESPNGGMFHFSASGEPSDSVLAVTASQVASM